jgi:hypothetical protein
MKLALLIVLGVFLVGCGERTQPEALSKTVRCQISVWVPDPAGKSGSTCTSNMGGSTYCRDTAPQKELYCVNREWDGSYMSNVEGSFIGVDCQEDPHRYIDWCRR